MQISGVTVKLAGDQAKLMENVSKAWTGSPQGKFSGKVKPQEEILTGGTDFASIIPSGFLLLHKDLQNLIDSKSNQKSGLMTIADAIGPILVAVGAVAIAGAIVKGLFAGNSSKSQDHIQGIIDDLNMQLTADDIKNIPEVQEAQRQGLATYMKSYFLAQGTSAVVTETLGAVGSGAAAAVTSLVKGLLGKETKDKAQQHLKDIIDAIILAQNPDTWATEATQTTGGTEGNQESFLRKEVRVGIATYLGLWFAAQAVSMTAETLAGGVGTAIGGFFNKLYNSLLGKNTDDNATTHLKDIIDAIITNQRVSDWVDEALSEGSVLRGEVRLGIMTYLGLWFTTQAASMTTETLATGLGSSIGGFFNSLFTSLFGKKKTDTLEGKLQDIISAIITSLDANDKSIIQSDEVQDAVKKGMAGYVMAYFNSIALSATTINAGESAGDTVAGFFKSLFGKKAEKEENDPMVKLGNKMQSVITQITEAISPEKMTSDKLLSLAQDGIQSFVNEYFKIINTNMLSTLSDVSLGEDLTFFMTQGIGEIARDILNQENSQIKNWYSSSLTENQVKTALGGISETYLKAVKTSIENGFKVETSSTINSKADNRIIEALAQIQVILNSISGDTGVIKDKQSLVMINGGDNGAEEPTIYSSLSGSESR